ncbi:hypothetical protein [Pyrobaculum calidifontis]|uniref:Uncharacterized protein n=1 Tax=Pyrobaculum calidifontis (strain DSM 21063 / JCM 11548 / VA1) TaxID=410359 RepID=A3MUR7_PYRCJ|nr:hypothetical protein [Pyrobaculum calidifontis]ABO08384.1 conserved hypothetical protein [Pyrobaculum calidifontis JCM 11548]
MYAFVDLPFSPSGVTHLVRLHKSTGLERELREALEVLEAAKRGNNNVLAVVVAPYGYGKSELLDELEEVAKREGFRVVRTALTLDQGLAIDLASKKRDEPMLVLIDEADEISRMAIVHKLGALSDERFMKIVQNVATLIRALLEPRSYRHILGEPERFNKVAIIIALTPQLYYTILKNVVPDVFDLTTGRVYKEIALDTRYPFWQYVETVRQRLYAYSTPERRRKIESGELNPLSPFTLAELAALYHLAKRKGETAPRHLMKLTARLFQYKAEGRRLAHLLREEGISPEVDDRVLELAFAGVPHDDETLRAASREVYVYKIPYDEKEALDIAREQIALRGGSLDIKDVKNISYEPYLYYSLVEGGKLYIYLLSDEEVVELNRYFIGKKLIISSDVAKIIVGEDQLASAAFAKQYMQKLENPAYLLEEVERALEISGIRLRSCCGYAVWDNNMGFREAYIFMYISREDELRNAAKALADVVAQGSIGGYVVDYFALFVASPILLTETVERAFAPIFSAYWKRFYPVKALDFAIVQVYGADKFEKLKQELVRYAVDKVLRRDAKPPSFVDAVRLGREKAREKTLRYTLALRKGKEKKLVVLVKVAEALDEGLEVEGLKAYREIEEIILKAFDASIHERELKSLIATLFPTNLWREIKEDDVIELMKLRGVLVPVGDLLYKYREDLAKRHVQELLSQLESLGEIFIERQTPLGPVRVRKRLDIGKGEYSFRDQKEYGKVVRELTLKLAAARESHEKNKREAEAEVEERVKLVKRLAAVVEKFPMRAKMIELDKLDEQIVKREEAILQKASEIMRIWESARHIAQAVGSALDVERDLSLLLELPEPWLDDYAAHLKLYVAELEKKYEKMREEERARKTVQEWLREKFGVSELDLLPEVAKRLGVDARLLEAVARRGRGAHLTIEELAEETGLDKSLVEEGLEKLYRAGVVEKRYVA